MNTEPPRVRRHGERCTCCHCIPRPSRMPTIHGDAEGAVAMINAIITSAFFLTAVHDLQDPEVQAALANLREDPCVRGRLQPCEA